MAKMAAPAVPLDRRDDFAKICAVAGFYGSLSGVLNGVALSEFATPVGYTSGPGVNAGRFLAIGDAQGLRKALGVCVNFYTGGIFAGVTGSNLDTLFKGKVSINLLLSAFLIALGTYVQRVMGRPMLATQILAFSQGLLNAIARKFSAAPISATHTAGGMTDAAYSLGQSLDLMRQGKAALPMRKAILNQVSCWSMFLGGYISILAHRKYGSRTAYGCAGALAASAVVFPRLLASESDDEGKKRE